MNHAETDIHIRSAISADATDISTLYSEAYSPNGKTDARLYYPFPQFLNPRWVAKALNDETICWQVAVCNNTVVGTVGALLNIGDQNDHITESFGLVIKKDFRNRKIGTRLYDHLSTTIQKKRSLFLIAETRTAHPGGYCIVRRCDLIPIGFEPLAHFTPDGHESMLVTAKINHGALQKRQPAVRLTDKAYAVASCVMQSFKTTSNWAESTFDSGASTDQSLKSLKRVRRQATNCHRTIQKVSAGLHINVKRDDVAGPLFLRRIEETGFSHQSGVVCLSRLEGEDKDLQRYDHQFFLAEINGNPVACARFALDKIDKRNRLLSFHSHDCDQADLILVHIIRRMEQTVRNPILQVVIDIRADNLSIQVALEDLGFFPTTFYPALIDQDGSRIDGIQYTHFITPLSEKILSVKNKLKWPAAQKLADQVTDYIPLR